MKKLIALASFIVAVVFSCKHEPLNELTDDNPTNPPVVVNPPSNLLVCFETDILPVFISNCAKSGCHDAASHVQGLVLTNYTNIRRGIVPNNPNSSKYWQVIVTTNPGDRMPPPPALPLTQAQKDLIKKWINEGAQNTTNCASSCDLTKFTYAATVKPILQTYCTGCHSGSSLGAGLDLTNYTTLKTIADNGRLMGSIKKLPNYKAMPPSGVLTNCQIEQIDKWVQTGAPNN